MFVSMVLFCLSGTLFCTSLHSCLPVLFQTALCSVAGVLLKATAQGETLSNWLWECCCQVNRRDSRPRGSTQPAQDVTKGSLSPEEKALKGNTGKLLSDPVTPQERLSKSKYTLETGERDRARDRYGRGGLAGRGGGEGRGVPACELHALGWVSTCTDSC